MFFVPFIYKGTDISAHMEMIRPLLFVPLRAGLFLFVPLTWIYYKIFLQPLEHFGFLVSYMVGGQKHYHKRKENL